MRQIILGFVLLSLFSCSGSKENKITVAVANNMQYAIKEITAAFEKEHGIRVEVSASSSGTLTTQIKQGAPFDVFISANMKYPNTLYKDGFTIEAPKVYAEGALVLWTLNDKRLDGGLAVLLDEEFRKVAIANPETAPYGIAAIEALEKANLHSQIEQKIVWGEGIGQVNQYIKSKSVDAGITSKSVLYSKNIKNKGVSIDVDKNLYTPIEQGIVLLKHGKKTNSKNAELFYKFMFSEKTKTILTKFGYDVK
ncbi:MAG: molybdate ABC transporter substrate-binding protein [Vicingaceae bacterium]|nr:molybdate ABC transporter substrate-binding protein [Vicingaceae bacterium]